MKKKKGDKFIRDGIEYVVVDDNEKAEKVTDLVKKQYNEGDTRKSYERRLNKPHDRAEVVAIKKQLLTRINDVLKDGKDFKTVLGESYFGAVADFFNTSVDGEKGPSDWVQMSALVNKVDFDEFSELSEQKQNTWRYFCSADKMPGQKVIAMTEKVFGEGSQTLAAVRKFVIRNKTFMDVLMGYEYLVTPQDIREAVK